MCGIVGAVNKANNGFLVQQIAAFSDLLFMDVLRGPDSTGVFSVDRDGDVVVLKEQGPAFNFLCTKEYDDEVEKHAYQLGKVLVGHNRKATVGKISDENAHPFTVNNEFVLVHNGSLHGHKHLGHDADVDSHAVAKYLHDKWNDDATPEDKAKVLAHIGGAWAFVWYDLRSNKLNIVRNAQRPLAFVETAQGYFFASEMDMLKAGLSRNNQVVNNVIDVTPYKLLTINLLDSFCKVEEVVLPIAPFSQVKTKTSKTVQFPGGCSTTKTTTESEDSLSKSAFKRFIKTIIGKTIPFYVEDFVDIAKDNPQNYYFYGESANYTFNHEVLGVTNEDLATKVLENYNCAEGKVIDASYNKARRLVTLNVELTGVSKVETATTH